MTKIVYRRAVDRDRTFIVEGFLESYRVSHSAGLIQEPDWFTTMRPHVVKILERPDVEAWVACDPSDVDHIADLHGFIVADPTPTNYLYPKDRHPRGLPLVYYVFVKELYRRRGIARGLFRAVGIDPSRPFYYGAKTGALARLDGKIPLARFNPLAARFPKETTKHEQSR